MTSFKHLLQSLRAASRIARQGRQSRYRRQSNFFAPVIECLENRSLLSVFTVTTTFDNGNPSLVGSLRKAIVDSNANPGPDLIAFNVPDNPSGPHIIRPTSPLPIITDPLTLDGYTQPGAVPGNLKIALQGSSSVPEGLRITAGDSTVRGLIIGNYSQNIIRLSARGNNVIEGNYVGYYTENGQALGNTGGTAVRIESGSNSNLITGNVVSGNGYGLHIQTNANLVTGNFIGTNAAGTAKNPNGFGVFIDGSSDNMIGGTSPGDRNVISGNDYGVQISGSVVPASANVVQGNYIGTDVTGNVGLGNYRHGISINGLATNNTVGGTAAGAGNVIAATGHQSNQDTADIFISGSIATENHIQGNLIGTNSAGTANLSGTHQVGAKHSGVWIDGAPHNVVGGALVGARNVISGQGSFFDSNVTITGVTALGNLVQGNFIGTDITGTSKLSNSYGVTIVDAPGTLVGGTTPAARNVVMGVEVRGGATGTEIQGNFMGTDVTGAISLGYGGVTLYGPANHVGGTTPGARNVMTHLNITTGGTGNVVEGNYIGTDVTGTVRMTYAAGVSISGSGNLIGGTAPGAGNVISGSYRAGLRLSQGANANVVQGNFIGTDATGTNPIGNSDSGVLIDSGAHDNLIGGSAAGARNVISGNSQSGIMISGTFATSYNPNGLKLRNVVQGNFIGTDVTGTRALGNHRGVALESGAAENTIGGTSHGAGNLISGNNTYGVHFTQATANVVQGNFIGIDVTGTTGLGNRVNGVYLYSHEALGKYRGRHGARCGQHHFEQWYWRSQQLSALRWHPSRIRRRQYAPRELHRHRYDGDQSARQ